MVTCHSAGPLEGPPGPRRLPDPEPVTKAPQIGAHSCGCVKHERTALELWPGHDRPASRPCSEDYPRWQVRRADHAL